MPIILGMTGSLHMHSTDAITFFYLLSGFVLVYLWIKNVGQAHESQRTTEVSVGFLFLLFRGLGTKLRSSLLLSEVSHQPRIVKSTILWLVEFRESTICQTVNKTKARVYWKHFSCFFTFIYLVGSNICAMAYAQTSKGNLWESVLSLHNVSPKDPINSCQEVYTKCFYPLSTLNGLYTVNFLFLQLDSSSN